MRSFLLTVAILIVCASMGSSAPDSRIAAASTGFLGIASDGSLWAWGSAAYVPAEEGFSNVPVPMSFEGSPVWKQISASYRIFCGVLDDGTAMCGGRSFSGALGGGELQQTSLSPELVTGGHTFTHVSVGNDHVCGVTLDGRLLCWGDNMRGQLGNGSRKPSAEPTEVAGGGVWSSIDCGGDFTCGIKVDGALLCWGSNSVGQLGDGTSSLQGRDTPAPVVTSSPGKWSHVSAGAGYACAVRDDGVGFW
jgi:alpha-tubulin suppressor-like RCC1 family protein